MDRRIAELIMKDLLALNSLLNSMDPLINQISNADEQRLLRRGLGGVIISIYTDLMRPIIKQYPELDPDKK